MPSLSLSFFGSNVITLEGHSLLPFRSAKVQALLTYLAVEDEGREGQPARRETLLTLLWPGMPETSARQNLRQTLYLLRQAIPEVEKRDGRALVPLILSDRQTVQINPQADYTLDVSAFLEATQKNSLAAMEQAVQLYRGDFLADFYLDDSNLFEEWAAARRSHFRQKAAAMMATLAERYEAGQEFEQLERVGGLWQKLDSLAEPPRRALMIARARSGRWSEALAVYQSYYNHLQDELGIPPSPELETLYRQIKERQHTPLPAAGDSLSPTAPLAAAGPEVGGASLSAHSSLLARLSLTQLVGRKAELDQLAQYLAHDACRLITITGPGGAGKTRLATEVGAKHASLFRDGVFFVPLEAVDDPDRLAAAIANALGHAFRGPEPLFRQLGHYLYPRELLLILDNFEQLLEAAPALITLLQAAPSVTILVTSQERLYLPGEWLVSIGGLLLPEAEQGSHNAPAVQLFVHCARRVVPDFMLTTENREGIIRVCRLLQGIPLGIELAAAWTRMLPPDTIAEEIEHNLDFIQNSLRGVPERHRSLRAVFDYMWQRLDEDERRLVRQLSVFRGGFTPAAAASVAGASLHALAGLVDKSLLHALRGAAANGAVRYEMHVPLRRFAREKLETTDSTSHMARQHAAYYAAMAAEQGRLLRGSGQLDALRAVALELDNLRAAWQLAVEQQELALLEQMLEPLLLYYELRSLFQEGLAQFLLLSENLPAEVTESTRRLTAYARAAQGWFLLRLADDKAARTLFDESLLLLEKLADERGKAFVLSAQALAYNYRGNYEEAQQRAEASLRLCAGLKDRFFKAFSLHNLGSVARMQSDFAGAGRHYREALDLFRASDHRYGVALSLRNLAQVHVVRGEWHAAHELLLESQELCRRVGYHYGLEAALRTHGEVLAALGDYPAARRLCEEAVALAVSLGDRDGAAWCSLAQATVMAAAGEDEQAAHPYRESRQLFSTVGNRYGVALSSAYLARQYATRGAGAHARRQGEESLSLFRQINNRWGITFAQVSLGYVALSENEQAPQAASRFAEALAGGLAIEALPLVLDALLGVALLFVAEGKAEQAARAATVVAAHDSAPASLRWKARRLLTQTGLQLSESAGETALEELVATVLADLAAG